MCGRDLRHDCANAAVANFAAEIAPNQRTLPTLNQTLQGKSQMGDLVFLGVGIASFVLLALYVFGCGRA